MKKRALRKDFYMEIVKTRGRFLSILFIVAMGVAFFSGIRSAEPDMRYSGDAYFDRMELFDISIISTMGLTDEDIDSIAGIQGVDQAEGLHSADVICQLGERQKVLRVNSLSENMNKLTVDKGRLPETSEECFVDNEFMNQNDLEIGEYLSLESGNEDALEDSLSTDTYRIVGVGSSPAYISYNRGSSAVGTGEVSGFIYITKESFTQEVYTEINLTVAGAKDFIAFTAPYEDAVEDVMNRVEQIEEERCKARREGLVKDADQEIRDADIKLADAKKEADSELAKASQTINDARTELADGTKKIQDGKTAIESAKQTLRDKQAELDAAVLTYKDGEAQLNAGIEEYNAQADLFHQQYTAGMSQIADGETQLAAARAKLDQQWAQYRELLQTTPQEYLTEMKAGLDAGEAQMAAKAQELAEAKVQLDQGAAAIAEAGAQIDVRKEQLSQAAAQLDSGQIQINEGWNELNKKQTELKDAETKLKEGEEKLASGQADYDKAKKEADEKLADAQTEITDAKTKVADIEVPEWYVKSREVSADYTSYGENADRMRAIGKVFPLLFFLVAALISLTTMTRMVEEQRIQIGTLKALGYSKFSIAGKYLNYALIATVLGSLIGVLVGEKILPYIIVYAYKTMYSHVPDIVVPYNLSYALMATAAAVVCTVAATLISCYRELAAQPSVLMRPPAPKKGKRILLERITPIWKHMNFTWKATMRNLFRYKKRFFMTLFGISGCMALLVVGFGLKDSVFGIADIQYNEIQFYDMMAYMKDDASEGEQQELLKYLDGEKRVTGYLQTHMKSVTVKSGEKERDIYLTVPKDKSELEQFMVFRDRKTKAESSLSEDGIILTEKIASLLNVTAGDSIEIELTEGKFHKITIDAVCENYIAHYVYMSNALYESLQGRKPEYNSMMIQMNGSENNEFSEIGEKMLAYDGVLNVSYTYTLREQLDDMLGSLNIVIVVLIISAGMLAFVVLYNLNNVNIAERKRELATIKVLGFYDNEVAAYVYRENILLTILGCGAGVILGRILHRFVIVTVEIDNAMFGRNIDLSSYIYSIAFTVGFSLFVNLVMYYKLKKIDMVESLKSIE